MTAVIMVVLAVAAAAWVLAPLRSPPGPAGPHGRGPAGDEGPGAEMERVPEGER